MSKLYISYKYTIVEFEMPFIVTDFKTIIFRFLIIKVLVLKKTKSGKQCN